MMIRLREQLNLAAMEAHRCQTDPNAVIDDTHSKNVIEIVNAFGDTQHYYTRKVETAKICAWLENTVA